MNELQVKTGFQDLNRSSSFVKQEMEGQVDVQFYWTFSYCEQ